MATTKLEPMTFAELDHAAAMLHVGMWHEAAVLYGKRLISTVEHLQRVQRRTPREGMTISRSVVARLGFQLVSQLAGQDSRSAWVDAIRARIAAGDAISAEVLTVGLVRMCRRRFLWLGQ